MADLGASAEERANYIYAVPTCSNLCMKVLNIKPKYVTAVSTSIINVSLYKRNTKNLHI